jgi:hypothetical protein
MKLGNGSILVAFALAVLGDAATAGAQVQPPQRLEGAGRAAPARQFRSVDEEFLHLATVVPGGFGGLFWDDQGRPNVYLTDPSKRAGAVTAVATALRGRRVSLRQGQRPNLDDIQILQGQYDFPTLIRWRGLLDLEASRIPGLVMLDADERANRVFAGVESAEAEQQVREALGRLNIPAEAVVIERRERPAPASAGSSPAFGAPAAALRTVEEYAPSVAGGYRIRWRINSSYYDMCTIGFNAWRWESTTSAWQSVFLTNSHCSNVRFGVDNMRYHQWDLNNSAHYIGKEIIDPPGTLGTAAATTECSNDPWCCPLNYRCRQADALVSLWESTRWAFGQIARTLPGSPKTIDDANPVYRIAGEISYPWQGETLYKVGATTGTSSASVLKTCTYSYPESGKKLLCQEEIRFGAQGGDSGGPVFGMHTTSGWVYLYGLLHGTFLMSAMSNIETDVGLLDTYDCVSGNPDYPNNCLNAS